MSGKTRYLDWKNWRWEEFKLTRLGKTLPPDCGALVKIIIQSTREDPLCILCQYNYCDHYDYIDGIGPVCASCNGF